MTDNSAMPTSAKGGHHTSNRDQEHPSSLPARGHVVNYVNEPTAMQQAALAWHRRGGAVVALRYDGKQPLHNSWQHHTYNDEDEVRAEFPEADAERNVLPPNLGILTGRASMGGLGVLDLDALDPAIAALALPETGLRDGRPGKPNSHWFYRITGKGKLPKVTCKSPTTGTMQVELLGDGQQTVLPPSLHPSGERRAWEAEGEPATVTWDELVAAVQRAAAFGEIAAIWATLETGTRHDAALALVGALLRAGVDEATIEALLTLIWPTAERTEIADAIRSTLHCQVERQPYAGWPRFKEITGISDEHLAKVLGWLGVEDAEDDRPTVVVTKGRMHEATQQVWVELRRANTPAFLFASSADVVRFERDAKGRPVIRKLDENRMRYHMQEHIRFVTPGAKGGFAPINPAQDLVRNVLATPNIQLPPLNMVTVVPVLSPTGELQLEPGYHAENASYYSPEPGFVMPVIPTSPTRAQIKRAKALIFDELLGDFPFEGDSERAHALALVLLPFGRSLIDGPTPIHFVEAPTQGTGKSLLADLVVQLFCGPAGVSSMGETRDEEEWRKRLTTSLATGASHLYVDNVTGTLDSSSIATAVTKRQWTDRLLGSNQQATYDVQVVWLVTANNAAVSLDLARRSVRVRLNAKIERPFERPPSAFRHPNIRQWAAERWGDLVAASLTLWRAWVAAGQPRGDAVLGSFEEWAAIMSGLLNVIGVAGFLDNQRDFMEAASQDTHRWRDLVDLWWERFGTDALRAGELYTYIAANIEGFDYADKRENGRTTAFGMELRGQRDNIYGDLQVTVGKDRKGKPVYRLHHLQGQKRTHKDWKREAGPVSVLALGSPPTFRKES